MKLEKMGKEFYKSEEKNIREWYMETYPTDEIGAKIDKDITFYDLFYGMDRYVCVYEILDVDDSIVRERVFVELAEIMGVDYDYIYDQWLLGARMRDDK